MTTLCNNELTVSVPLDTAAPLTPWQLLRRHARGLFVTYGLFAGENLLALLQPWLLGQAVQGLIVGNFWPTLVFLGQILAMTATGSGRLCYDARFFSRIYATLAGRWAVQQRAQGRELAQVAARAVLARQLVDFLERDLPFVVQVIFQLLGAAILILLDVPWMLVGFLLTVAIVLLQCPRFIRETQTCNRQLHDQLEKEVAILQRADSGTVADHYGTLAHCYIRLADVQARQFAWCQGLTVLLIGCAFWSQTGTAWNLGRIVALFGYLQMFSLGLTNLFPWVQQCLRLRDVVRRLREQPSIAAVDGSGT